MNKTAILLMLCLSFSLGFAESADIVDSNGTTRNVDSSAAFKVYVDTFGANPDFALGLCGVGQKYVAAVYSANVSGTIVMVPVSKSLTPGSTDTLVYTSTGPSGTCYYTPVDAFAFSQFRDFTRTPPVYVSAFPGRIHALYSDDASGSTPGLVALGYSNGWLRGGYSTTSSFTQAAGAVSATVTAITFTTDTGGISRNPSDPEWGLNSSTGRSMLVALCSDDLGDSCDSASIINSSTQFPASLPVVGIVDDQHVYNRYVVVDGIGTPICVGANLVTSVTPHPGTIAYGGSSNITITVSNSGNVNVSTDFYVQFNVSGSGYSDTVNYSVTETIPPGGSITRNYTFNATAQAGTVNLRAYADSTNLVSECSKADNLGSNSITIQPAWYMHVWIDGNYTNTFPSWGRPYNVTIFINNSDGGVEPFAQYTITEYNGLNPFVPTQVWNDSGTLHGVSSYSAGIARGNGAGYVMLTIVPTCNKLFTDYSYLNASTYVGNYYITVRSTPSHSFVYNGTTTADYPLLVLNKSCDGPGWVNNKELVNKNTYVLDAYDWIYEVYSNMKKLVVP